MPQLPHNTQVTLKRAVDDDVRWVLSLSWRRRLGSTAGSSVSPQRWPRYVAWQRDLPHADGRHGGGFVAADAERWFCAHARPAFGAGRGSKQTKPIALTQMLNAIPDQQRALTDWLESDEFLSVGWATVRRFPEPGYGRPSLWSEIPDDLLPAPKAARVVSDSIG